MFGVFNIAVLVDEMGFDEVTLHKVTKFVHTYYISVYISVVHVNHHIASLTLSLFIFRMLD